MGTSNIYKGPGGVNKLLPEWLQEQDLTEKQQMEIVSAWKAAKTAFTKAINHPNYSPKIFLKHYAKAYGGSQGFIQSSKSFDKVFSDLLSFSLSLNSIGKDETLKKIGDDFQGKNIEEILMIFSNKYFPSGNTKEESAVREAMVSTIQLIYEELSKHKNLDVMDDIVLNVILRNFIGEYISARILSDLGSSFESSTISIREVKEFEARIKEMIKSCVDSKLGNTNFMKYSKDKLNVNNLLFVCIKEIMGE